MGESGDFKTMSVSGLGVFVTEQPVPTTIYVDSVKLVSLAHGITITR